jgi:hypothetical protein
VSRRVYPPLPDVPACWTWDLPPLPQKNCTSAIATWQADRCAICALYAPQRNGLYEDHCHRFDWVRGYLCPRCNTVEGQSSASVFEKYRERYPALMLGVTCRRGRYTDPEAIEADQAFWTAVQNAWYVTDSGGYAKARRLADLNQAAGYGMANGTPWPDPDLPEWTPLMRAVHRVGLTPAEWSATLEFRRNRLINPHWRPYDPDRDNPMRRRESVAHHDDPTVRAAVLASLTDDERRQLLAASESVAS